MNNWKEGNFLERLAQIQPKRAAPRLCPEAERLRVSIDSDDIKVLPATFPQHLADCPACADLRHRLDTFDQDEMADSDSEVLDAERHLDCWLTGFLAARSLEPITPIVLSAPKGLRRLSAPRSRPFLHLQWALAAAAVLAIAIGGVYIRHSISVLSPTPELSRATPVEQPQTASSQEPARAGGPQPEPTPKIAQRRKSTTSSSENVKVSASTQSKTPQDPTPQVTTQRLLSPESTPSQTARANPINPIAPPKIQVAPVVLGPVKAAPKAPSSPTQPANTETVDAHTSPGVVSGSSTSRTPVNVPSIAGFPRSMAPRTVQLPGGTRVWLSLISMDSLQEGRFRFHASLLLPVTQSGTVLLDKGAEVTGLGQTIAGQTSIQITEIVNRAQRYKPSLTSSKGASASASGKALRFQSGQVLEMWLDSASTFAAESDSDASPRN